MRSDSRKKFKAYATEIPIVIKSWLKDPMNPVMFKGDIDVRYIGITVEETPQKNPKMNLVKYMACSSKVSDWTIKATAIMKSTRIMLFFYPIELSNFPQSNDPT